MAVVAILVGRLGKVHNIEKARPRVIPFGDFFPYLKKNQTGEAETRTGLDKGQVI